MRHLLLILCSFSLLATSGQKAGKIKFLVLSHSFGDVLRGQKVSHSFEFTNIGTGPLEIMGVHAPCGCTVVEAGTGKVYQPGESGTIVVTLDTTDFTNQIVKPVTVVTSEPITPDRTLTVSAMVRAEIMADPPIADFGELTDLPATRTITLRRKSKDIQVKDIKFDKRYLQVELQNDSDNPTLKVDLLPGIPVGFFKSLIEVTNTSTGLPELPIPVRANKMGLVSHSPSYLEFGAINANQTVKRELVLSGPNGVSIRDSRVQFHINGEAVTDGDRFVKIGGAKQDGKRALVPIEVNNPSTQLGSVHGKIRFSVEAADPVEVEFYAFFR
jgi:hypothetical protein